MLHSFCTANNCLLWLARRTPDAIAHIQGSEAHPDICGQVYFYQRGDGVFIVYQISGLPLGQDLCEHSIFAMHIHSGESCTGASQDPFADAGAHYNLEHCPHPSHAGDLPPLFGDDGYAWGAVFTNRFTVLEIIGRTVIIHDHPDDFTSQPAGNSGNKIACGVIRSTRK